MFFRTRAALLLIGASAMNVDVGSDGYLGLARSEDEISTVRSVDSLQVDYSSARDMTQEVEALDEAEQYLESADWPESLLNSTVATGAHVQAEFDENVIIWDDVMQALSAFVDTDVQESAETLPMEMDTLAKVGINTSSSVVELDTETMACNLKEAKKELKALKAKIEKAKIESCRSLYTDYVQKWGHWITTEAVDLQSDVKACPIMKIVNGVYTGYGFGSGPTQCTSIIDKALEDCERVFIIASFAENFAETTWSSTFADTNSVKDWVKKFNKDKLEGKTQIGKKFLKLETRFLKEDGGLTNYYNHIQGTANKPSSDPMSTLAIPSILKLGETTDGKKGCFDGVADPRTHGRGGATKPWDDNNVKHALMLTVGPHTSNPTGEGWAAWRPTGEAGWCKVPKEVLDTSPRDSEVEIKPFLELTKTGYQHSGVRPCTVEDLSESKVPYFWTNSLQDQLFLWYNKLESDLTAAMTSLGMSAKKMQAALKQVKETYEADEKVIAARVNPGPDDSKLVTSERIMLKEERINLKDGKVITAGEEGVLKIGDHIIEVNIPRCFEKSHKVIDDICDETAYAAVINLDPAAVEDGCAKVPDAKCVYKKVTDDDVETAVPVPEDVTLGHTAEGLVTEVLGGESPWFKPFLTMITKVDGAPITQAANVCVAKWECDAKKATGVTNTLTESGTAITQDECEKSSCGFAENVCVARGVCNDNAAILKTAAAKKDKEILEESDCGPCNFASGVKGDSGKTVVLNAFTEDELNNMELEVLKKIAEVKYVEVPSSGLGRDYNAIDEENKGTLVQAILDTMVKGYCFKNQDCKAPTYAQKIAQKAWDVKGACKVQAECVSEQVDPLAALLGPDGHKNTNDHELILPPGTSVKIVQNDLFFSERKYQEVKEAKKGTLKTKKNTAESAHKQKVKAFKNVQRKKEWTRTDFNTTSAKLTDLLNTQQVEATKQHVAAALQAEYNATIEDVKKKATEAFEKSKAGMAQKKKLDDANEDNLAALKNLPTVQSQIREKRSELGEIVNYLGKKQPVDRAEEKFKEAQRRLADAESWTKKSDGELYKLKEQFKSNGDSLKQQESKKIDYETAAETVSTNILNEATQDRKGKKAGAELATIHLPLVYSPGTLMLMDTHTLELAAKEVWAMALPGYVYEKDDETDLVTQILKIQRDFEDCQKPHSLEDLQGYDIAKLQFIAKCMTCSTRTSECIPQDMLKEDMFKESSNKAALAQVIHACTASWNGLEELQGACTAKPDACEASKASAQTAALATEGTLGAASCEEQGCEFKPGVPWDLLQKVAECKNVDHSFKEEIVETRVQLAALVWDSVKPL